MKKIIHALSIVLIFYVGEIKAQTTNIYTQHNLKPASPTAFQFLKYTEIPVSEYTGIPNISIPIYEIKEDGISVPISLTYHSVGVRVNQEASWVGLGWDLQPGSIVQTVNGVDDYLEWAKVLPDFIGSPLPSHLPKRFDYPFGTPGAGWTNPYPVNPPLVAHAYSIATNYYIPVNGNFDIMQTNLFEQPSLARVDSESDIFKANFLGHTVNFIRDLESGQLVVLNKKGYEVTRINGNWRIIVPSGEEFYFEEKTTIETQTTTEFSGVSTSGSYETSSNIWMLTKVITNNKKQIVFNYTRTALFDEYPQYSEKWQKPTYVSVQRIDVANNSMEAHVGEPSFIQTLLSKTYSRSREQYLYLSSIVFPKGQITFTTSTRQDVNGARKLDNIQIQASKVVKTFQFNYSYFDAGNPGGNGFQVYGFPVDGVLGTHRLKLLSVQDNSGATHTFTYDATTLPKKNSFATDYWSFYNGQISNTTLIPNPSQFNLPSLGNNGNNHSANLTYAKAGILQAIQYPTGGKVIFDYELNEFDNYWVPDFASSSNVTSKGLGLRIKSVVFQAVDNVQSLKTIYSYSGGKAILPVSMFRSYSFKTAEIHNDCPNGYVDIRSYTMDEVNISGSYSPSQFGSVNGVGYRKVTKEEKNLSDVSKGRTETFFFNNPDIVSHTANAFSQVNSTLPAFKDKTYPENGSVDEIFVYNDQNTLLRKTENNYANVVSGTYYGARIFGYPSLVHWVCGNTCGPNCATWYTSKPRHLVGFYPIFDFQTQLQETIETEFSNNQQLITTTKYSYETQYNLLVTATIENSNSKFNLEYSYPFSASSTAPVFDAMVDRNRLSDIVSINKFAADQNGFNLQQLSFASKEFVEIGDKILESKVIASERTVPFNNKTKETTYDQYDNNGNPLQITENSLIKSYVWDYNSQYVIAEVINAPVSKVAYSSFESDGLGGFTKNSGSSILLDNAFTGKRSFSGTLTKTIPAGNYVVTLWSLQAASSTVNGQAGTVLATKGNYQLRQWKLTNASSVQISGTSFDEVRLYPQDAEMTTYTYDPLVGITSECDINNRAIFYNYDQAGRMILVRDDDKNIIKKVCYNYSGQAGNCNIYFNTIQSANFTRNNCPPENNGGQITYTIPAGVYASTESPQNANDLATMDITANGQAFANTYGTCTPTPCSVTMASGFTSLTTSISNNGATASLFMVIKAPSISLTAGNTYTIGTIGGSCKPDTLQSTGFAWNGRIFTVTIETNGTIKWTFETGSPIGANTNIDTPVLNYNL